LSKALHSHLKAQIEHTKSLTASVLQFYKKQNLSSIDIINDHLKSKEIHSFLSEDDINIHQFKHQQSQ